MQEHAPTHDEPETAGQMDDINIPLVAVSVAFFGCLLAVTIISLQAWFMNADRAEISRKTIPQEDPRTPAALTKAEMITPLGQLLQKQRAQLAVAPDERKFDPTSAPISPTATTATNTATNTSQPVKKLWIPIDTAMGIVSKEYAQGTKP